MRLVLNAAVVASLVAVSVVVPAVATAAPPGAPALAGPVLAAPDADVAPAVVTQLDLVVEPVAPAAQPDATVPGDAPSQEEGATPEPTADADAAPVTPDAVDALVAQLPVDDGRVSTPVVEGAGTQTVGVTWPEGVDGSVLDPAVRTLQDGTWSDWTALPVADEAPDAGTPDALRSRGGTDAVWVGDVEAVQLSFASGDAAVAIDDVKVALVGDGADDAGTQGARATAGAQIEPSTLPATQGSRAGTLSAAAGPLAAATQPAVVTRAAWGARNQACAPDSAPALVAAVVHHTATTNAYSSVDAAKAQIRNIQAYHIDGRGWCDIGYNFLVDKWGNIYEGRANGMTQAVVGVHAGGFNTGTVGVSMLGDYTGTTPSAATQDAVGRIIGWRLGAYGVDPRGSMSYYTGNGDNSRFKNQWVNLPRVFGHRDTAFTTCPGNGGYATLGTVRDVAARTASTVGASEHEPVVKKLYRDLLNREADATGLAHYSVIIAGGGAPSDVATSLATSPEYAYATVARDYQAVLRRGPDPEGTRTWTDAIIRGLMRSEDLRIWLFGSREYYNRSGETDASYVAALYRDVLGREASAGDVAFWAPLVASHGRDAVVRGFWKSAESGNVRVQQAYQHFLGRGADPAGMRTWPPVLLSRGEGELRSQLVNSLEYRNIARAAS